MDGKRFWYKQMKKEKSFFLWLFLFIFLTTYSFNSAQQTTGSLLPIKIIEIEGIKNSDKEEIVKRLNKFKDLPLVYGKEAGKNFSTFYQSLADMNFQMELIKQFNYFDINRWDVILKDGKVVKLPNKNYENSLNKFLSIYKKNNFSNFKVFDFRIKGQLVLK